MDWTKITNNQRVISLLKQRQKIEKEIKAIDENALIMYELEVLSIPDVVNSGFYCMDAENSNGSCHCPKQCNSCVGY